MTYPEVVAFLYDQLPMFQRVGQSAYKKDLTNTQRLCAMNGDPQNAFPTLHIAGTNGKGSVAHCLAAVYETAGFRTGLYTSPHLVDFRERIRVNGELIPEEAVIEFVEAQHESWQAIRPSFFEITFAMALHHFRQSKVDIAVIETGMGGRLDSTNILNPEVSVITNVGLDHQAFLGNSIEAIAREKAGIVKAGIPMVTGAMDQNAYSVIAETAKRLGAPLVEAPDTVEVKGRRQFDIRGVGMVTASHDVNPWWRRENIATALAAVYAHGRITDTKVIGEGLDLFLTANRYPGRWQILGERPLRILDAAHNLDGLQATLQSIHEHTFRELHLVLGFVADKDVRSMLQLLPANAAYYLSSPGIPRGLPVSQASVLLHEQGLAHQTFAHPFDAWNTAIQVASSEDLVVALGSIFLLADILEKMQHGSMSETGDFHSNQSI